MLTANNIYSGQVFETKDSKYELRVVLPPFGIGRSPSNIEQSFVQVVVSDANGRHFNDDKFDVANVPNFLKNQAYFFRNANQQQLLRSDILIAEVNSPVGALRVKPQQNSVMPYKYFMISYGEFGNGLILNASEILMYTSGPTDLEELKRSVRNFIHKPEAVIVLFNVQEVSREAYITLGGKFPGSEQQ